jgi:Tol biopolymer transport system component
MGGTILSTRTIIKGVITLTILASISCSLFSAEEMNRSDPSNVSSTPTPLNVGDSSSGASNSKPPELSPTPNPEISAVVKASEGGELTLPDGAVLKIPPESLQEDSLVSIRRIATEDVPTSQQELINVGGVYDIDLGTDKLEKPAILEIPFDITLLPDNTEPSQVFLSYYDEDRKEWVYAGGEIDTNRNVVVLQINHASWWMPTTWNWGAWIAVLNKFLRVSIVDWTEAVQLLTDDCPQTGKYVQVDSSQTRSIVQGCVEQDDIERPILRVVNPKSFFFEIRSTSGGNGYPVPTLLSPGEDLEFEASILDPSPLVVKAQMTEKSGWYLVVHMVITMLPGANQFGVQGHHVACITERLADVSYFASVTEALLVDQNGAAAAENISQFMLDSNAVHRFIMAADDCNFGPAPTWSVEGVRQIGGAVSTIMSATDYIANYLAGNTFTQVSFYWDNPVPTELPPTPTPLLTGGRITFSSEGDIYVMNTDGSEQINLTTGSPWDIDPAWSPDGRRIAFASGGRDEDNYGEIYVMNADGSNITRLTYRPTVVDWDPAWSPDGKWLAFESGNVNSTDWDIYVINVDGSGLTRLTNTASNNGSPTWSPDGTRIGFSSEIDGNMEIYTINIDGSGQMNLSNNPAFDWNPAWSPDGKHIAFVSGRDGNEDIYVMNADGSEQINLTGNSIQEQYPTWSLDSSRVAFTCVNDNNFDICIINTDGSGRVRLTSNPSQDSDPSWK